MVLLASAVLHAPSDFPCRFAYDQFPDCYKVNFSVYYLVIYIWLWRCRTARGSSTGLSPEGPTKAKACKYFLFTRGSIS